MSNSYKKAWEKISAPSGLIQTTEYKMEHATSAPQKYKRYCVVAASLVAVCLTVYTIWHFTQPQLFHFEASRSFAQTSLSSSVSSDSIYINKITALNQEPFLSYGPMITHKESWTLTQYIELLGVDPRPAYLPAGFIRSEPESGEISFQREVRCDFYNTWEFSYETQNGRKIVIYVNPSFIPYWSSVRCYQLTDDKKPQDLLELGEDSIIGGTRVKLWYLDRGEGWDYGSGERRELTDYYCADFWYQGAGFTITAECGVTEEELVKVIKSIIS